MSVDYKIKLEEKQAHDLKQRAEQLGFPSINQYLVSLIHTCDPVVPSLDKASEAFLAALEPEHQKLLRDCAEEAKRSVGDYILAAILRARDQGAAAQAVDIHTPHAQPVKPTTTKECAYCGQVFFPSADNPDQKYCPPPETGESCGRKHGLHALRNRRNLNYAQRDGLYNTQDDHTLFAPKKVTTLLA